MDLQVARGANSLLVPDISASGAQMGVGFLRSLSREGKNVVISPISIQVILNLILLGSKLESQTEDELVKFLEYGKLQKNSDKNGAHAGMLQVVDMLNKAKTTSSELKFDMANLILAKPTPSPDYTKAVNKFYRNTKWERFSNQSKEELVKRINNWIAETTHNEIKNLADSLEISADVMMIMTNAAYFRGEWLKQFSEEMTIEMPFLNQGLQSKKKQVKFMRLTSTFRTTDFTPIDKSETDKRQDGLSKAEIEFLELSEKLDCRAISLPFSANKGDELDMIILLPNKPDGLHSMLNNLTGSYLMRAMRELDGESPAKIEVNLPKFAFERVFDVKALMQTAGVKRVFSDSAELDRMITESQLKVDQILHKAKITVDEKGAVAAAATIATYMMRSSSTWLIQKNFKADHPFLFVIRHKPSGMPTFMGTVVSF